MFELGRLCIKTAGRDAGLKCVIISIIDDKYVMIDGETRRRKCNVCHLEPLDELVELKKDASHEEVNSIFKKLKLKTRETKVKEKKQRPRKVRKIKKETETPNQKKQEVKEEADKKIEKKPVKKKPAKKPTKKGTKTSSGSK